MRHCPHLKLLDGLNIQVEHVRMRGDDNVGGLMAALHVARQRLDRRAGAQRADGADGLCKVLRAAVRQIVARRAGQNDVAQPQLFCRLRDVFRLVRVGGQGLAARDVAEPAVAGADIAEDHKRGGVLLIALAEIRTVCRLADCVELQIAHQLRNLAHGLLVITDAQPFRFPFHSVSRLYFVSTIATGASASMVSPSSHS